MESPEYNLLKKIYFFERFSDDELHYFLKTVSIRDCTEGQIVVEEGDPGDDIFIILSGQLSVTKRVRRSSGEEVPQLFGVRHPGEMVGEMALMDERPRSARLTAIQPTRLLVFDRQHFEETLEQHPRIFFDIIKALSRRLRESNEYTIQQLEQKNKELEQWNVMLEQKVQERTIQLHQRNYELEELNRKKNDILGICAHDLRNPITIIQGYTELIMEAPLSEQRRHEIGGETVQHCHNMISIINKLLNISAIQNGRIYLDFGEENLDLLIYTTVSSFEHLAAKKSITLATSVAENLPAVVIDSVKIKEVLDNLISNALKYSHPHTTIEISLKRTETHLIVSVKDQGQGLSQADIELAFNEFQKLSARPTNNEPSTGLGLAIAKRLIQLHQGDVWIESEGIGKGATFSFSLPLPSNEVA